MVSRDRTMDLDEEANRASICGPSTSNQSCLTLLYLINGIEHENDIHDQQAFRIYSGWYKDYLNKRITASLQINGLREILVGMVSGPAQTPSSLSISASLVIPLLEKVAKCLTSQDSSLASVIASLSPMNTSPSGAIEWDISNDEIREPNENTPGIRRAHYHMLFHLISWLLMLYTPASDISCPALCLELKDSGNEGKLLRTNLWKCLSCTITNDLAHLQFRHLLSRFGDFMPRKLPSSLLSKPHYDEPIIANNFSYRTLVNVARLRIVWVDSISLHLELDQRMATLKLFRFPSFCAMLALPRASRSNALVRIFQSDLSDDESNLASESAAPYSQDFFVEVLCSLRLIFSQRKSVHKRSFQTNPRGGEITDPLFDDICGGQSRSPAVYEEIGAFPEKGIYSSSADFPLLAHRLLILQNFVGAQNPNDLRSLFNDTRDLNRFYTFWAVIVVGGASIFLAIVQIIIAGFQIQLA